MSKRVLYAVQNLKPEFVILGYTNKTDLTC